MDITEWIASITDDTQSEISAKTGIPRRTLQYQLAQGAKMETVITISETYSCNPITALVTLGYIDSDWLAELDTDEDAALMSADEEKLADEVLRRMLLGKNKGPLAAPISELDVRRRPSNTPTPNVEGMPYAADNSPDEPEMGDDGYHDGP